MIATVWSLIQPKARPRFLFLLAVVLLGGLVELGGIATVAEMMSLVATGGKGGFGGPLTIAFSAFDVSGPQDRLRAGLVVSLVILGLVNCYSALRAYLKSSFVWLQESEISTRLLSITLQRPYSWFLSRNVSQLLHLLLYGGVTQGLINGALAATGQLSIACTLTIALIWIDPKVAMVGGLVVVVAYGVVRLATRQLLEKKGGEAYTADQQRRQVAHEALLGIRFVKTAGRENFFLKRYQGFSQASSKGMIYHTIYVDVIRAFLEWVSFGGILTLSVFLILQSQTFEELLPRLTLYTMASYRIVPAVHELFGLWTKMGFDQDQLKDVRELLDGPGLEESVTTRRIEGFHDSPHLLEFDNVSFRYIGGDRDILDGVDLKVSRREWIGIVGTTGAGKTTMLDLMSGLCQPTAGCLKVGASELTPELTRDWQNHIGVVPQEVIMVDDTLARNVAFGLEVGEVDLERVARVCSAAGLDGLIATLPDGLKSSMGDRGMRLSGGERQRVGIARALYLQPDLLLLDEATSALDQATEAKIVKTLRELSKSCTLVTVAHRLSSVKPCDRILVMEHGKIADEGTYSELIEKSAKFQELALIGRVS